MNLNQIEQKFKELEVREKVRFKYIVLNEFYNYCEND